MVFALQFAEDTVPQPPARSRRKGGMSGPPAKHLTRLRLADELAPSLLALEEALQTLARRAEARPARVDELDRALTRLYSAIYLRLADGPSVVDRLDRLEEQMEGGCRLGAGVLERLEAIEAELAKGVR